MLNLVMLMLLMDAFNLSNIKLASDCFIVPALMHLSIRIASTVRNGESAVMLLFLSVILSDMSRVVTSGSWIASASTIFSIQLVLNGSSRVGSKAMIATESVSNDSRISLANGAM